MWDVAIIGCGVTGAAIAYELAKTRARVVVLEAENDVCDQTSKANSAISHAGYDPLPGTLMAKYNAWGNALMGPLCRRLDIPYINNGSCVVAFDDEGKAQLTELLARGRENGVPDLRILTGAQARKLEPNLSEEVAWALDVPTGGLVDPWELTIALAETAVLNGAEVLLSHRVTDIERLPDFYRVHTTGGEIEARFIVNAAGVYSDKIHNMVAPPSFEILPTKGEYLMLDKSQASLVTRTIFQGPTKAGKGVLVAPTTHGNLICGPTAEVVPDRGDVSTTAGGMARIRELARRSVPAIDFGMVIRNFSGVRAASRRGHDFVIGFAQGQPRFLDVAAIQSPGLTSAPAIAMDTVGMLRGAGLDAPDKEGFIDGRTHLRFKKMDVAARNALIQSDSRYGRVVCRCETITEGEIVAAIHRPIVPRSLDAVKRRCTAGIGRCQGGFCGPKVLEILARELNVSPMEILQDREGTVLLVDETKTGGGCR